MWSGRGGGWGKRPFRGRLRIFGVLGIETEGDVLVNQVHFQGVAAGGLKKRGRRLVERRSQRGRRQDANQPDQVNQDSARDGFLIEPHTAQQEGARQAENDEEEEEEVARSIRPRNASPLNDVIQARESAREKHVSCPVSERRHRRAWGGSSGTMARTMEMMKVSSSPASRRMASRSSASSIFKIPRVQHGFAEVGYSDVNNGQAKQDAVDRVLILTNQVGSLQQHRPGQASVRPECRKTRASASQSRPDSSNLFSSAAFRREKDDFCEKTGQQPTDLEQNLLHVILEEEAERPPNQKDEQNRQKEARQGNPFDGVQSRIS